MGNTFVKITITHKYADTPPRGWGNHTSLTFSTMTGSTFENILEQINKHRRPECKISFFFDETGKKINIKDTVYQDTELYL